MYQIPVEILALVKTMFPQEAKALNLNSSLTALLNITKNWCVPREQRVNANLFDQYASLKEQIFKAADAIKLRESKLPSYKKYECVVILGTTGLSYFQIWQDLTVFHEQHGIRFKKIFLLGGDRLLHPIFDSLDLAYKLYPQDFKTKISGDDIKKSRHEMDLMELIYTALNLPPALKSIPVISVFTAKPSGESQSNTEDTLHEFIINNKVSNELPILIMSVLPYIVRQGLQAKMVMRNHQIDTAALNHAHLETLETPLKGELPLALYLDELHWLLFCIHRSQDLMNT